MSRTTKRTLVGGTTLAVLATLAGLALFVPLRSRGEGSPSVREIRLEAKGVAFNGDNPTLGLVPGERVRLVVRNSDPGVLHSIALPGIDSRVRDVAAGEEVVLEFTVPEDGRFEYTCPQHAPKMRGEIVVEAPASASRTSR